MSETCREQVAYAGGWTFHDCGRPVKFIVTFKHGQTKGVCGIHAKVWRDRPSVEKVEANTGTTP